MHKGDHKLSFEFELPECALPCSFESRIGTIRYYLRVIIDIPYASPPQGLKYFTIIGPHIDCMEDRYLVSAVADNKFCFPGCSQQNKQRHGTEVVVHVCVDSRTTFSHVFLIWQKPPSQESNCRKRGKHPKSRRLHFEGQRFFVSFTIWSSENRTFFGLGFDSSVQLPLVSGQMDLVKDGRLAEDRDERPRDGF